jgi:glycosyltransferase involved in cell wall biosynthesis
MTTPAEAHEPEPTKREPGFPATVLALVERGAADDGIAYAGLLLERALGELAPYARTISVFPDTEGSADPTLVQRGLFRARLLSAGRRADCVVFNHVGVATAQRGLPARLRRPYAVFVHGKEAWDDDVLDASRRRALAEARILLASSELTARKVREARPQAAPAEVCALALLPEGDGGAADGALVSSITQRTVVIAGRMSAAEPHEGQDVLLEAWQAVLAKRPDARLVIVGRGDDQKRLEAKASGLGLAGSVRFTGLVTEATLDAMLARAGGFARPSQNEGSGLGYLRAMRAGVPSIAGTDDVGREMVEDGETGILATPTDRESVAQAVITLLGDSGRRRAMGEAARQRFEERFTFERFRERLGDVMRRAFVLTSPLPRS